MTVWALVPARGGSKSIPLKNLVSLAGMPLLDYGVRAVQASGLVARIICSTDEDRIAARAGELGIEIDRRPAHLATDEAPVADVAREFLGRKGSPDILILVQPTSPFLLSDHVRALLDAMARDSAAHSGQTVTSCPHNHHAWNQREVANGRVRFKFPTERAAAYNKQSKPRLFVFGNLVAVRPAALLAGEGFFAEPSVAVEIPAPYDFDLDRPGDVAAAEALLRAGAVQLPHMKTAFCQTST
jgi:CMP-N,N'-diacetyllegionaminic acid synthase